MMKVRVQQREKFGSFGPIGIVNIPIEVPIAGALTQDGVEFVELHFDSGMVVRYEKMKEKT